MTMPFKRKRKYSYGFINVLLILGVVAACVVATVVYLAK